MASALQTLFTDQAEQAAREAGLIRRRRTLTGPAFAQGLVFGWLDNADATLDELTAAVATAGARLSTQALDQRFTEAAADCLRRLLGRAVARLVAGQPQALPLLARFRGVYLLDGTAVALPAALAGLWPGCGGRTPESCRAGLKVQVRWDLLGGALDGLQLQAGKDSDAAAALNTAALPPGSLRLADLGYFDLGVLAGYGRRGVYWLTRLKQQTAVFVGGQRVGDLAAWLAGQGGDRVEQAVELGCRDRLACRLLAARVPEAVAARRRQRLQKEARDKGEKVRPGRLALCAWSVWVTNVPAALLSLDEALVLGRVRWQVELLFKLWKSQGGIDRWRSDRPYRVLCEVYAKLLAMVVQHWVLLTSWGQAAGRSTARAARQVRGHALHLLAVLGRAQALGRALDLLRRLLEDRPRVQKRRARPATFQIVLDPAKGAWPGG